MADIPSFLKKYFWDIDFHSLSLTKNKAFILKRILDRGDTKAINWLNQNYTKKDIETLITTTRDISQKTANFWTMLLGIDPKRVPCLQKPYSPVQFGLSS